MGLLDNLFKPKPESGGEKSVEGASSESGPEHAASTAKSQFLAPKIYVPRSSVQIVPPVKTTPQGERKLAPVAEPSAGPKEIVLTLGDVLSRIPAHFLREGKPDLRRELRFPAEGLAADIAHGRAGVYLAEIVAQCPDLFLPEVSGFDDIQIRLPLQKLVEQIGLGAGNHPPVFKAELAPSAEDKPAIPLAANPAPPAAQDEVQIHLSLAAIMRRCPREIIVQSLPPIEESVRITFPFAPIERQLSTGQVEVSSLRFIAALPLGLMKCFEARAGVKVPLPLEEIFQNLPNHAPRSGVETRPTAPAAPQDSHTETFDHAREDARLAESILLEPMFEPVRDAAPESPAPVPSPAPVAENVVISANFAPETPAAPAPEVHEPVFIAQAHPEKTGAAVELEATLEALAAEDARIESRVAEEELLAPPPTSLSEEKKPEPASLVAAEPLEVKPVSAPEMQSQPAPPLEETVANVPAPPAGLSAVRHFTPTLRPPVILQPKSGPEELRPFDEVAASPQPAPDPTSAPEAKAPAAAIVAPSPAPIPPPPIGLQHPPAPVFAGPLFSAPAPEQPATPEPEPLVEDTLPIAVEPAPVPAPSLAEVPATTLRIGPPQFRPFVVHAPPIVRAPAEAPAAAPLPPAEPPVIAEAVDALPPEPVAPAMREEPAPEPQPQAIVESPVEKPAAPLPDFSAFEAASHLVLDGQVREFFPSDAPLPLPRVSQLLAALPGIHGCLLLTRTAESHSGQLPHGLDPSAIRDLSQRLRGALADRAETFGSGEVQHLTLHAERFSLSLFTRGEACACAIHRARIFLPGVREKFAAVAEELARASR